MTDKAKYRILEIIPGFLVWLTFIFTISLSLFKPLWAIYFIIAFDVYWLLRISYMLIHLLASWKRFRHDSKVDWFDKVKQLDKNYLDYYHLIFLPTYKEPYQIVEKPFKALIQSNYDLKKFIVVLAGEERDQENFLLIAEEIKKQYADKFFNLLITVHPKNLPDELPGKGSNTHYAGRQAQQYIDQLGVDYDKVIVSNFDIDTCVHTQYFACLTYKYLTHPKPTRASYQPVAIYNNNIWESNPVVRVVASSTTFWLFTDLSRSERLFTFSSHSMSFRALVDVGFWDKTIVTEDSRIFLQGLVRYNGDYETVPMYIPVYMNTVDIGQFWRSLKNQYKQMRRWAWGVEHFPWMVKQFWFKSGEGRSVPFLKKIYYLWNQTEGVYSWATAPIIILIAGHLPLWLAGTQDRTTALFQNAPHILSLLMRASMVGLIIIAVLYTIMLPRRPQTHSRYHQLVMLLQWIMVPVTLILFGSLPATDAQTRLMLGGKFRLGFWVTEKK
ncbi:MAG: glycosyltransferase family 2 protein [Candidatus Buchananbacteria bacterium]|nr:glycosyltransferase family 2 protein [Candidatus Buchananbacteria bacterium]